MVCRERTSSFWREWRSNTPQTQSWSREFERSLQSSDVSLAVSLEPGLFRKQNNAQWVGSVPHGVSSSQHSRPFRHYTTLPEHYTLKETRKRERIISSAQIHFVVLHLHLLRWGEYPLLHILQNDVRHLVNASEHALFLTEASAISTIKTRPSLAITTTFSNHHHISQNWVLSTILCSSSAILGCRIRVFGRTKRSPGAAFLGSSSIPPWRRMNTIGSRPRP